MDPAEVVLRFLESVGRRSEAEFYVQLFRATPREQFAAISVDANVARHATEAVVLDLRFLAGLGLSPVVVLGLFEPTDAVEHGARIQRRLAKAGVPAALLATPRAPSFDEFAAEVARSARAGTVPIVTLAFDDGATVAERVVRLGELLSRLRTRKLIFLHRPGGLRQKGALVPMVNLTKDYAQLAASKELSRKEQAILDQSRRLILELIAHPLHVAITSPLNLFRELFTMKGAGTFVRRGATIASHAGWEGVDVPRLERLLVSSFGRAPLPDFFERPVARVYVEAGYRGAAVLVDTPLGAYLTKFAVEREAQGEGLGRDLWDAFAKDHPVVFWRARAQNPIVEWYGKLADGMVRAGEWQVYWKGLATARIPEAIGFALAQPIDLAPALPPAGDSEAHSPSVDSVEAGAAARTT